MADYPSDAVAYQTIAKELATQGRYWHTGAPSAKWPPLWPLIIAGKYFLLGPGTEALHVIQLGLSVITIGATYGIARIIEDWRLGVISALLLIFDPLHIGFTAMLLSGISFVAFFTLSLFFYFRIKKRGQLIDWILFGVFAAFMSLTRPTGLAIALVLFFFLLLEFNFRNILYSLIVFFLLWGPWVVRNYVVFEAFIPTSTDLGNVLAGTYNDVTFNPEESRYGYWYWGSRAYEPQYSRAMSAVERDRLGKKLAIRYALNHIKELPFVMFKRVKRLLTFRSPVMKLNTGKPFNEWGKIHNKLLYFLAGLGIIYSIARRKKQILVLGLFVGFRVIMAALTYGDARFALMMRPLAAILAGYVFFEGINFVSSRI